MTRIRERFICTLDGIVYGIVATVLIVCYPRLGNTLLGDLGNVHMIPVLGVVIATLALDVPPVWCDKHHGDAWCLKIAALTMLGLSPFVSWWLRTDDNFYLLVAAGGALYAGIWYLLELTELLRAILHFHEKKNLEYQAKLARFFLLFFLLTPTLAVYISFIGAMLIFPGTVLSDLQRTWQFVPILVRCLMVLSVLNVTWLLWNCRRVLQSVETDAPPAQLS